MELMILSNPAQVQAQVLRRFAHRVAVPGGYPGVPYGAPLRFLLA